MSPLLAQVLREIEQLSPEEQLEVISHTTKLVKRQISGNPVWQAYLESKQERQEVYRRLANS
jgi:bifunctional N-acetylglucosamine-1-phosphate-uridyltransferase/glucosamine-1-phosphate-acetyltransferase GlmU-like protein